MRKLLKIAFVDDEKMIHTLLKMRLQGSIFEKSIEFHNFYNGKECLNFLEDSQNAQSFDLVFTDISMPEMDGIELASNIKSRYPETDIYFMSALTPDSARQKIKIEEISKGYFEKPLNLKLLTHIIEQRLN